MSTVKRNVVIGLLGPVLDNGAAPSRWEKWRPTVALCQHPTLLVDRFELLRQRRYRDIERTVVDDIRSVSPETTVVGNDIEFDDPWEFEGVYAALHDWARGYDFDTEREDYFVHITTGTHVAQICMFLLTESHRFPARLIQTSPPARKGYGEPGSYAIIDLDLSKYDRIAQRFHDERQDRVSFLKSGIATRNAAFNQLIDRIEQVADASREPILLMGPTGAGKSRLAGRIYELKRARHQVKGAFVEVNCATLKGEGAMSALFGHVKGSFTGAMRDRPGLLRAADGGLLFLDEIGELGGDEQAMLLRALEQKTFLPLGGDREVRSDFQLIAGTNRDLGARVADGAFRDDLLARINLWTFELPGLRDRVEDVEPNLNYEIEKFAARNNVHVTFAREARDKFLRFAASPEGRWEANFRDLNGAVTRMATLAPGGRITVEVVSEEIARLRAAWPGAAGALDADAVLLESLVGPERFANLDAFDRVQLAAVVRACQASRTLSDAGRALFSASREAKRTANDADRLRKYLARFGLAWADVRDAG